jgi:ribA/ribD-fused uncharacterized protein
MTSTPIDRFVKEYDFLSNFYEHPIVADHLIYPTLEHAFQAAKTEHIKEKANIAAAKTPGKAKRLGRKVTLIEGWDKRRLSVMLELVRRKFENKKLRQKLLQTGDRPLIEGNNWGDTFWGMCKGRGQNHLGKILEQVREEIRNEQ